MVMCSFCIVLLILLYLCAKGVVDLIAFADIELSIAKELAHILVCVYVKQSGSREGDGDGNLSSAVAKNFSATIFNRCLNGLTEGV